MFGRSLQDRCDEAARSAELICAKRAEHIYRHSFYQSCRAPTAAAAAENGDDTDAAEHTTKLTATQIAYADACARLQVKPTVQMMAPTTAVLVLRFQVCQSFVCYQ